jgi:hypothetical protein
MRRAEQYPISEAPMTPEDFRSIVETNIGGITFDPNEPEGNVQRLPNMARRDTFNPFKPSTWQVEGAQVPRQYQVILPLRDSRVAQERMFTRQVIEVFRMERSIGSIVTGGSLTAEAIKQRERQTAQETERFCAEYPDLVTETFQDLTQT